MHARQPMEAMKSFYFTKIGSQHNKQTNKNEVQNKNKHAVMVTAQLSIMAYNIQRQLTNSI